MLEGPFTEGRGTDFTVTISIAESTATAVYAATGELNAEQKEMVREGTLGAFRALALKLGKEDATAATAASRDS